ncbi:MFS transporter [Actinomadura kijaniata]|uniref:MFS transporter n=1 Tax=Actinomadura kijaniata TaxID=46161 RepID=UPI000832A023|nr:MFS transporter [Actinomadura kijaniata]
MPPACQTPVRSPTAAPSRRHAWGFWVVAVAFATLMAFGTLPTPLWPMFAARDHFGATMVTVAFAVMVLGISVGFLSLGHLSDRVGRRVVLVPALLTSATAALLLTVWHGLAGLLVARVVTGLGAGLMASTATAYLDDLYARAHPDRPGSATPGLVAAVVNLGGLAIGPLLAGVLGQWGPAPLTTPFVLAGTALAVLAALAATAPETVDRRALRDRPRRFGLRDGARAAFAGAAGTGFLAFAVMGFFAALGAVMIRDVLGMSSVFVAGMAPFALFAASAVAQLALGRLPARRLVAVGLALYPVGLALTAVALFRPVLAVFLAGAAVTGAGAGLLFKAAVGESVEAARPESRAGVLAVFFVISYVGTGLVPVAFSLASHAWGPRPTVVAFAVALSAGAVLTTRLRRG